ncbi:hypothetical protein O9G_004865 [Rozella allomycis CSF55]|uniref:Uncharacterized protein n=1 Tax=Rozella allomycis (strain CSF55) TaxID=988480 RepID=A0A075ATI5_ROZAC|nr:hypothetical protein O9G_004865 [Rozella allomycis CSF55]|eukprot:EPZ32035.1 hypothetical protein O9G_004865 [Rozella allomycis CSF55]
MNRSYSRSTGGASASRRSGRGNAKVNDLDKLSEFQRKLTFDEEIQTAIVNGVVSFNLKSLCIIIPNFDPEGYVFYAQITHFPVTVSRWLYSPTNLLKIQIMGYQISAPKEKMCFGSVFFHLFDVIESSPLDYTVEVWNDSHLFGNLSFQITYNYGYFGYGYSSQINEKLRDPDESVRFCLFPRLIPHPEETEPDTCVIITKAVPHPHFIPFKNKVKLSYGKELNNKEIDETQNPVKVQGNFVERLRSKVEYIRDRYYSFPDRTKRIAFIKSYFNEATKVMARYHDKEESSKNVTDSNQSLDNNAINSSQKDYTRFTEPLDSTIGVSNTQQVSKQKKLPLFSKSTRNKHETGNVIRSFPLTEK